MVCVDGDVSYNAECAADILCGEVDFMSQIYRAACQFQCAAGGIDAPGINVECAVFQPQGRVFCGSDLTVYFECSASGVELARSRHGLYFGGISDGAAVAIHDASVFHFHLILQRQPVEAHDSALCNGDGMCGIKTSS